MNADLLKLIRADVRRWPGGKSIHDPDNNDDTFAPSTIGFLVTGAMVEGKFENGPLAGLQRARELGALAETAAWDRAAADELLDLFEDRRAEASDAAGEAAYSAWTRSLRTGRAGAMKRVAIHGMKLAPLQQRVIDAQAELGPSATASEISAWLATKGFEHSSSNVAKAQRKLREKTL